MPTLEEILSDPMLLREAMAQAQAQGMPMQPEVTAQEIQPSEKQLNAAIAKGFQESLNRQKQQTEALRGMLLQQQMAEGQKGILGNLNIRPFAQALKQYGVTNVVVPEEAPKDNTAMMMKLREAISEGEQGLGKQQLDYLRSQLLALREGKAGKQAEISLRNAAFREMKEVVPQYIKLNTMAEDSMKDFAPLERTFSQKEIPIREITMLVTNFGKRMGEVGAQAEGDRRAYWDPDYATQLLSAIQKASGRKQTISRDDPNVDAMIKALNDSKEAMARSVENKGEFIAQTYGTPDSPVGYLFAPGKQGDVANKKLKQVAGRIKQLSFGTTKDEAAMKEKLQLEAELKALKGGS